MAVSTPELLQVRPQHLNTSSSEIIQAGEQNNLSQNNGSILDLTKLLQYKTTSNNQDLPRSEYKYNEQKNSTCKLESQNKLPKEYQARIETQHDQLNYEN